MQLVEESKSLVLAGILRELGSVVVAFSGGVDSTLLLKVAVDTLPIGRVLAVNAGGNIYPASERQSAASLAKSIGAPLVQIDPLVLETPAFIDNPPDRCYHCKLAIFSQMKLIAAERGLAVVVDGSNRDDRDDYRPGSLASRELGVRSPLDEAGFTKEEIRALSRELGLPTWNKPSMACLASRFPYGDAVTAEKLAQVEQSEELLKSYGFKQYRVRHHGQIARIEVTPEDMPLLLERRIELANALRRLKFDYVTMDLVGYRTGAMNEVLESR